LTGGLVARIQWGLPEDRVFHGGIDQGVLYLPDGTGVPWNGLISVDEKNNNTVEPVYFDGVKFNDIVTVGEYSGLLTAFTYPDEFYPFDGLYEEQDGFYLTHQNQERFSLSYRSKIGNDLEGYELGYKIHVVYNLTAKAAGTVYKTLALDDMSPHEFQWDITGIPEAASGNRPTCHVIFDSTDMDPQLLQDIEDILYGDEDSGPTLPRLPALISFIRKWDRLIITDNGDGTWTADARNDTDIVMTSPTEFLITAENVVYLDEYTYEISSSDKNEEDIG